MVGNENASYSPPSASWLRQQQYRFLGVFILVADVLKGMTDYTFSHRLQLLLIVVSSYLNLIFLFYCGCETRVKSSKQQMIMKRKI